MTDQSTLASPLKIKTMVDTIEEWLEHAIISGDLPPGSRLSEQELANKLSVSRGPLREAMGRLEGRGLLSRMPNKGVRVPTLSKDDLSNLLVVREALEGMACRLAAESMTESERNALQHLLEAHANKENVKKGEGYFQESKDFDFHFHIIKGSRNERLITMAGGHLYDLLRVYRYKSSTQVGRTNQAIEEHRQIVEAVMAQDGAGAEAAMREHLSNARVYTLSCFED